MKKAVKWIGILMIVTPLGSATVIVVLYLVQLLFNIEV